MDARGGGEEHKGGGGSGERYTREKVAGRVTRFTIPRMRDRGEPRGRFYHPDAVDSVDTRISAREFVPKLPVLRMNLTAGPKRRWRSQRSHARGVWLARGTVDAERCT